MARWQANESLLYGEKPKSTDSRANIDLQRAEEFVDTYLSKIDSPLRFKFGKRKESQFKRVRRLNALRERDADLDYWDLKDLAGKKQNLIYGRAIYCYYADSVEGYYRSHLENVDVYDFLIDPSAGGLDMERGKYMGRYGVVKDRYDLKGSDIYIKAEVRRLVEGESSNSNELSQEETNKKNRRQAVETLTEPQIPDKDKFKFWEWYTTFEGERYYLLLQEQSGIAIRAEKLTDIFPETKQFPQGAWPFWSYAKSPDLTEFWTKSRLDQVREIFMTQNVNVNQMVDNVEEYNKPMKVVNVSNIKNLAELKYRKGGHIKSTGSMDVAKDLQVLRPSAIDTPIQLFNLLETIHEKASGLTAGSKGAEDSDGKVGIYEGNQENAADRFGLTNKTYSFGTKRFAQLYEMGVRQHLTKKVGVDILGPEGIETETISKRDIFRKDDEFSVIVEASDAEERASVIEQRNKLTFLSQNAMNPVQNQKKAYELGGRVVGFKDEEIKELLDTSEFGNAEILSEAARDIEDILDGKPVKPNRAANTAYKQKFVDYMADHEEDMQHEQFTALANYIVSCEPFIMANAARALTAATTMTLTSPPTGTTPVPTRDGAVTLPTPESNGAEIPVQGQ